MVLAEALHHQFVISACEFVGGFGADKANLSTKCRGYMTTEKIKVEEYLRVGGIRQTLEEISGERGVADGIFAAVADRHVLQVGCSSHDHRLALLVREDRTVFLDNDDEETLHHTRCALHKITMTESEGIAVHDDATHMLFIHRQSLHSFSLSCLLCCLLERLQIIGYSAYTRLHEYSLRRFGKHTEGQTLEELAVTWFGKELHTLETLCVCLGYEVRDNHIGNRLSLVSVRHCHAFYDTTL